MYRLALLLPFAAIACSAAMADPPPTAPVKAATTGTDQQACVESFQRNRTCTDEYIPALVDTRAKYDNPTGIADKVKADRAGIIAAAKAEWADDSKDEAIANTCQRLVAGPGSHADVETARGCLAQTDCAGYVSCVMPIFDKHLRK